MKRNVKEEFTNPVQDMNGGPQVLPDPVNTGDPHAERQADNLDPADTDVVVVPGVGPVNRADTLKALLMYFANLDPLTLSKIANDFDIQSDFNATGTNTVNGDVGVNMASISTHEDVNQIFAGETLSEDFKAKTAVVFEAALGARLVVLEAEMEEKHQAQITEAVEAVTEEIVSQIDKYLSYAAEQFTEENKVAIETTVKSTVAEEFMAGVIDLARKYNVDLPENKVDVVEALSTQVSDLETKINEGLTREVTLNTKLKKFEKADIFDSVAEGLTLTQKERLRTLSESIAEADVDTYKSKITILKESVAALTETKPKLVVNEVKPNGVSLLTEEENTPISSPEMKAIMSSLKRISK